MRRIVALFAFALSLVVMASAASAERRVALVIGQAAYKHAPALGNPANDARAVAVVDDDGRTVGVDLQAKAVDTHDARVVLHQCTNRHRAKTTYQSGSAH